MLVLSTRTGEKIVLPEAQTTVEVVEIQSGNIRLGIEAPAEFRVIREGQPDRVIHWAPLEANPEEIPTLPQLKNMLEKRLEIAREGIAEANGLLRAGQDEDARMILEKVDEDLHMLRRRIRREFEKAETMSCGV